METKGKGLILLLSGTSGAGKNTIIRGMEKVSKDYKFTPSYTTRERRESDTPNQYQYITVDQFQEKLKTNEIFEYDIFNNNYYGTSRKLFIDGLKDHNVVLKDISVMGVKNITDELGKDYNIVSVFLTEKKSVLKQRLINRGEKPEKIKARLKIYSKEQSAMNNYDFVIRNNIYENTLEKVVKISEIGLGKARILPTKGYMTLSAKKIDKFATKLEKGKTLKPITVSLYNDNVYIIDGMHRYIASLKTGINVAKVFVDIEPKVTDINLDEWDKIINSYKK